MKFTYLIKLTLFCGCLVAFNAHAWFFVWIPTGKIADALSGAEGENCVSASAKVGDKTTLPNGAAGEIKSLSGTSSRCTNPALPIRALIVPILPQEVTSEAKIDIPDGWEQKAVADNLKIAGVILHLHNKTTDSALLLSVTKREGITDINSFVTSRKAALIGRLDNSNESPTITLSVNDLPAWRYEVTGNAKSGSKMALKYMQTFYEGSNEIISVNIWTSLSNFDNQKNEFIKIANSLTGLSPPNLSKNEANPIPAIATTSSPSVPSKSIIPNSQSPTLSSVDLKKDDLPNPTKRLENLNDLFKKGLINQKEYDAKKAEILKSL